MRNGSNQDIVLIADDDMFVRKVIKKGLSELAECHEIADGADFIAEYQKLMPDVVFLDIHLPNESGLDLIVKLMDMDPAAYVIMLSADSTHDNVKEAVAKGAKGFLVKPFTRERLVNYFINCPTIGSLSSF